MVGRLPRPLSSLLPAALAVAATVLASCGGSSKVGEDLAAEQGSSTSACRLGECTTTTAASPTTRPPTAAPTTRPPTAAPTTTKAAPTTTRPAAVFVVTIRSDQEGRPFDPQVSSVSVGTTVRWTNADSVARSVESDTGAFSSPTIPPGGSFDYVATAKGTFRYHDGTRPYAVATLEVG